MSKLYKCWWSAWLLVLIVGATHYAYMASSAADIHIIKIEHKFYLYLWLLAAVSFAPIKRGKFILCLLIWMLCSHIYLLPESYEITRIQDCTEGKCLQDDKTLHQ